MGRSVNVPSGAAEVVYLGDPLRDPENEEHQPDGDDWDMFYEDVYNVLAERYPSFVSFVDREKWIDREGRIVAENHHARVVVSEYCGAVSIALVPIQSEWGENGRADALAAAWCARVGRSWREYMESRYKSCAMRKMGTFSNGGSVYTKVA